MLRWKLGNLVVDNSVFKPGKELDLEILAPAKKPSKMQVFQVYESAVWQVLRIVGRQRPKPRAKAPFLAVEVSPKTSPRTYRSDSKYRLPEVRGFRKSAAYTFSDIVSGEFSQPVYASRFGKARFIFQAGAAAPAPIPVGGQIKLAGDILLASDPDMSVDVLTGAELKDHMVANLIREFGDADLDADVGLAQQIRPVLSDLDRSLVAAYAPPSNWTFGLTEQQVSGDEGQSAATELVLDAPVEGTGYFALRFHDPATDLFETTDVLAVEVDGEGNALIITDLSEMPLPLIA